MSRLRAAPPPTGWVTYLRCHDDIGWAVSDADAAAVGWNGFAHRSFLNDFYSGRFPGSYARGLRFQENPATGDARISGMAAALCGITAARESGDPGAMDAGVRRLVLLYSVVFSYGGIPLLYMGDELALDDDERWAEVATQAADNRWAHRPPMDWSAAARRHDPATVEGRVFAALVGLARARRELVALRAGGESAPLWTDNPHVFAYRRRHLRSLPLVALVNFAETEQTVDPGVLAAGGLRTPTVVHGDPPGPELAWRDGRVVLPGLGFVWLLD